MVKEHVIIVTINNNTTYNMEPSSDWYDSGRLADGWSYPTVGAHTSSQKFESYEKDNALTGCSGYVNYKLNGGEVTIAFSNPLSGHNKIGCNVGGKTVWDNMDYHDYEPFVEKFTINGVEFVATCLCSGSNVNQASVSIGTTH